MYVTFNCPEEDQNECSEETTESSDLEPCCKNYPQKWAAFGHCTGINFIFIAILAILLFFSATFYILYYLTEYGGGIDLNSTINFATDDPPNNKTIAMNNHAFLNVLGYIALGGTGIVMYKVSSCCENSALKVLHVLIQLGGLIAIYYGSIIPYAYNNKDNKPQFNTLHGKVGLFTHILYMIVFGCGILKFLCLLACGPVCCCVRASCIPVHSTLGIATYWAAITSIVIALQMDIMSKDKKGGKFGKYNIKSDFDPTMDPRDLLYILKNKSSRWPPWIMQTELGRELILENRKTINQLNPNPPHQDDDFTSRAHATSGLTVVLIACGLLLTYAVISRLVKRGK